MIKEELSKFLGIPLTTVVTNKRASKVLTLEQVLDALLDYQTLKAGAESLNLSRSTFQTLCLRLFPEKETKQIWRNYLLSLLNTKYCFDCDRLLSLSEFPAEDRYTCIACTKSQKKAHYASNIDRYKQWSKNWRIANPDKMRANDNKRRAREANAISSDANDRIIVNIYTDCPKNYHVDHVIPISRGGLHHENNLCYLPGPLNLAKGNKMPEKVPEIMEFAIFPDLEVYK